MTFFLTNSLYNFVMMERIRLQRKFNLKNKVDALDRLGRIGKMMIVYELTLIMVVCLLNLSLHFHISHIFTCQFWTTESIINSNMALTICTLLLLPYLIFYEKTTVALIKDYIATALFIHTLLSLLINQRLQINYIIFILVLGAFVGVLGNYGAIFREQKRLIDQIRTIQSADRSQYRLRQEQSQNLTLCREGH